MLKKIIPLMAVLLLLLSACATPATPAPAPQVNRSSASDSFAPESQNKADLSGAPAAPAAAQPPASSGSGSDQSQSAERLVIRTADLSIIVDNPSQAMDAISQMASALNGYVVSSNLYQTTAENNADVLAASITVRVPSGSLDQALGQVKGLTKDPTKDVLSEQVSGQDITKEYTDLQSHLTNLQNAADQLREIMKSAQKTEDVLAVYNQLSQIEDQIQVTQGQINYYKESAAMSSISVNLQAQAAVQPVEIGGWQPVGVARDAVQTLINALQVVVNIVIWLIIFVLPIALIIFIPLRLLWWLLRRNRKNAKSPVQAPPAPPTTPTIG